MERRGDGHEPVPGGRRKITAVVSALLLAAALALGVLAFKTEPKAKRAGASKQSAMLVDFVQVERGAYRPRIVATGVVEAERDILLSPQVGGEIVWRAPELTPGGLVDEGDVLVRIEPADYRNVVQQRRADLSEALAGLQIEMGRQHVARSDYELLDEDLSVENEKLVLRQPQLEAARGRVEAARAAVHQARLDLRRTTVEAPFDAQVLSRGVNAGSRVTPGDTLARLVGLDTYWVVVTVPLSKLRWLSVPRTGADEKGSPVRIRNRGAWPEGKYRTGVVNRLVGALDERTRMARVIVDVPDPLGLEVQGPALMIGAFVEVDIRGKEITDAVRLDRDYVREGDTVWLMKDGKLEIRKVQVAVRDPRFAYVTGGLDAGDRVVTTDLATVTDGARLRSKSENSGHDGGKVPGR